MGGGRDIWPKRSQRLVERDSRVEQIKKEFKEVSEGDRPIEESCIDSRGNTWKIYKHITGEWRWQCVMADNQERAVSTESYKNKLDCIKSARKEGMDCDPS